MHNPITIFAQTNFRNQQTRFGIKQDDRRRHMYIIGKTGMGKSALQENMIINDIWAGHGVAVVDPHGDLVEKVIKYIPAERINDVIYFNPADTKFPIAFNVVERVDPEYRHLVASGLIGIFQKLWADSWGPRLEYILRNAILAILDYPDSTLMGVTRMLSDKAYRKKVIEKIQDPVVKAFWVNEFAGYADKFANEAVAPIQNKVGQFLSSSLIRNIVGQVKSNLDLRKIMDERKILLLNLSKGHIGEDNSALLGAMMITKLQLAAMSRVDTPESERQDFYLYVDEFQNFATNSFASILSEARKYRLNLIVAHQYIAQLGETGVWEAIQGNVGTMIVFRVGAADAEVLVKEFEPHFIEEDLVNLPKYQFYIKLMIDGVASHPFSAVGLLPKSASEETGNTEKVINVSRERYANPRDVVEEKIMRWHGLGEEEEKGEGKPVPRKKSGGNAIHHGGGLGNAGEDKEFDINDLRKLSPSALEQQGIVEADKPEPAPVDGFAHLRRSKPLSPAPAPAPAVAAAEAEPAPAVAEASLSSIVQRGAVDFKGRKVVEPKRPAVSTARPSRLHAVPRSASVPEISLSALKQAQPQAAHSSSRPFTPPTGPLDNRPHNRHSKAEPGGQREGLPRPGTKVQF